MDNARAFFQDVDEFFPTPARLIDKMLAGINLDEINTILEPSAGKGDIVAALIQKHEIRRYSYSNRELDIDVVEVNANLQHVLKGQGYRVIQDDFLTLQTFKQYDLIVMNPPFSAGDKHLLKAIELQQNGGKIICLLNAETLRNPFSIIRKDLVRRLEEYNAEIEFIAGAFTDAERKTVVDIALIKIDIPKAELDSFILKGLRQEEYYRQERKDTQAVTPGEFIDRIVAQYNFEVRAGLSLIREYKAMIPLVKKTLKKGVYSNDSILHLGIEGDKNNDHDMINSFIKKVRYKYWEALFLSDEFVSLFTSNLRDQYFQKINELKNYDFSHYNILQIKEDISRSLIKSVEETILALFDEFSHKHHWQDETSKNVHYYNGWKTNKAWIINKKVIIPYMSAWASWSNRLHYDYRIIQKLMDIEKVFNYLDAGLTDHIDLQDTMKRAENMCQSKKVPLKYFTVSFFKKGTCHIEFTNLELLKKFNLFGSQRKGWLPPSYGKANYEDMNAEEQAVINSFEGKEEYQKVMKKRDYYLYKSSDIIMIESMAS